MTSVNFLDQLDIQLYTFGVSRDGHAFWAIIEELKDDSTETFGFYHNKSWIVEAYSRGEMFGLRLNPDASDHTEAYKRNRKTFCHYPTQHRMLPCVCVVSPFNGFHIELLWIHPRARNNGFAKKMINELCITHANQPMSTSLEFWRKMGVGVRGSTSYADVGYLEGAPDETDAGATTGSVQEEGVPS